MNRFERVKQILDDSVNNQSIGAHGAFWIGTTRDQFVSRVVFGRQLLVVGNGAGSNLVKALRGQAPFGADLPSPPPGAMFSRMPANRPPVSNDNIEFIRQWIDEGCLEDVLPEGDMHPSEVDVGAGGVVEPLLHTALWRNFDNWAMFEVSTEVNAAIGEFFNIADLWQAFARNAAQEAAWQNAIEQPVPRAAIGLLAEGQFTVFSAHFGQPIPLLTLLDAFERFGDNSLPDDPLRPNDRHHNMNGHGMWAIWSAFADACLRLSIRRQFWLALMRAILLGMLNDGLFRGRLNVVGFNADVGGKLALRQHIRSLPDDQLPAELARRFIDSGIGQ